MRIALFLVLLSTGGRGKGAEAGALPPPLAIIWEDLVPKQKREPPLPLLPFCQHRTKTTQPANDAKRGR